MERVDFFVGRNFPAFRHAGDGMKIVRIFSDQSFEQGGNDVERADAVDEMRIEILDLFAVSFVKYLEPISFFDRGLNSLARDQTKERSKQKPRMDTDFHGCAEGLPHPCSIRVHPWQKILPPAVTARPAEARP